jgi:hypothetical protein
MCRQGADRTLRDRPIDGGGAIVHSRSHRRRYEEPTMPDPATRKRAAADKRSGKSPGTQAGEYVKEEIDHIREGKHGARSAKQAIAIGLSKARRDGVALKTSKTASAATRKKAAQDVAASKKRTKKVSAKRSRAVVSELKHEGQAAASATALSRHSRSAAAKRGKSARSATAKKAARTRARTAG